MKLSDFDYNLPKELIAHKPASPRDSSRLLILNRKTKRIEHKHFYNIADYLKAGDVLVLNNTKVFPARLIGRRQKTGGRVEVFLLKRYKKQFPSNKQIPNLKLQIPNNGEIGEVLIGNRRKKVGQIIEFKKGLKCEITKQIDESVWEVRFNKSGMALERLIDEVGEVPTPPYIKTDDLRPKTKKLRKEYQTVYAENRGSVAAPTAGFHFTKSLINKLKKKGVQFKYLTLHVGYGTFEPVKIQNIKRHKMHAEFAILNAKTAKRLNDAKKEGRRIIAVGTTSVRLLESAAMGRSRINPRLPGKGFNKWIDTFIYPGYKFKFIDVMITNFHLPKSTLLMLVSAFAGRKFILKAYQAAIRRKYRFYSFGDAMFIV